MFSRSTSDLKDRANASADSCGQLSEYLQTPIYQVFEKWEEQRSEAEIAPARMFLRPWCGSKVPRTLAFDFALTAEDKRFLKKIGIKA